MPHSKSIPIKACVTLCVSLLAACGKSEPPGPPPTSPSVSATASSTQTGANAATPALPEFHGIYVLENGKYIEMKKSERVEDNKISPQASILVFHKSLSGKLKGEDPRLIRMANVRYTMDVPSSTDFSDLVKADIRTLNGWLKDERVIPIRTKSVDGKPEMLVIVPQKPLEPGGYDLDGFDAKFSVTLEKVGQVDQFSDGFFPIASFDARCADAKKSIDVAFQSKDWMRAIRIIDVLLKLTPQDASLKNLQVDGRFSLEMERAASSEKTAKFGAAFQGFKRALTYKPNDSAAKEAVNRTREAASRDPSLFQQLRSLSENHVNDIGSHRSIAFSPDGVLLGIATRDEEFQLQKVVTGEMVRTLKALPSLDFSPDGKLIAGRTSSGWSNLWEVSSGKDVGSFNGRLIGFKLDGASVAFSVDNSFNLAFFDIKTGRQQRSTEMPAVAATAIGADFQLYATGANAVSIHDLRTGGVLRTLAGDEIENTSIVFGQGGKSLAVSGWKEPIRVYELESGKLLHKLQGGSRFARLAFHPGGRILAAGTESANIDLWDLTTGIKIRTLSGHRRQIACVAFSPDGKYLASGSEDGAAWLWGMKE